MSFRIDRESISPEEISGSLSETGAPVMDATTSRAAERIAFSSGILNPLS
jgi:hypothetical protein